MSAGASEGERILALRVLEQALLDATASPVPSGRVRSQCRPLAQEQEQEQEEARRFLHASTGEWAAARVRWCNLAGVSAEWLQRKLE